MKKLKIIQERIDNTETYTDIRGLGISNHSDQIAPKPFLIVRDCEKSEIESICKKFNLSKKNVKGDIVLSAETKSNYKEEYLILFFSSVYLFKKDSHAKCFMTEELKLRTELNLSINQLSKSEHDIQLEMSDKIDENCKFYLSLTSQLCLNQSGLSVKVSEGPLMLRDRETFQLVNSALSESKKESNSLRKVA